MSIQWSTEQRRDTASNVLAALISNSTLTTTAVIAAGWDATAVQIADKLLKALDGTITSANQEEVVQLVAPTIIKLVNDIES